MTKDAFDAQLFERLRPKPSASLLSERDSIVYRAPNDDALRVVRRLDGMNRVLLTYHTCDVYTHSVLYPDEPLRDLQGAMYLVPGLLRPPHNVLVLGSAAGGCLRQIEVAYPRARVTAIDMDPRAHDVARNVFGANSRTTTFVTSDARAFLRECSQAFDLIIIDVFAGTSMPPQCLAREFFELARERLTPEGGLFLNTNMDDLPFEVLRGPEPFRPIRHLQSAVAASGFRAILENSYFNSLFAFRRELSIERFRCRLLEWLDDETCLRSLRAAAGLAAFTTVEVHANPERYRPFVDDWSPAFSPMAVRASIYSALKHAGVEKTFGSIGTGSKSVPDRVLQTRFEEWNRSGEPALRNLSALIRSLNQVQGGLSNDALDVAARFFRFRGRLLDIDVHAQSAWAQMAFLYSRLYTAGYQNDYESVLPILQDLRPFLAAARAD